MLATAINYDIPADPVPHPHPPERAGRMGKATRKGDGKKPPARSKIRQMC